jgi:hypothetical protein
VVDERKRQERRERLSFLAKLNKKRCEACPIYGSDLIEAVTTMTARSITTNRPTDTLNNSDGEESWSGFGKSYVNCLHASLQSGSPRRNYVSLWSETETLKKLIQTPEQRIEEMNDLIQR